MKFCPHCGASVEEEHRFCRGCGQSLSVPPPAPPTAAPRRDYAGHVKLLAAVLVVWGGLGLLGALGILFSIGSVAVFFARLTESAMPLWLLHAILVPLAWVFLMLSGAAVAAGVGLLDYKPWGRWLALAVCILALLRFPLGTAIGIYGLWVLLSTEGERHYQAQAATRGW